VTLNNTSKFRLFAGADAEEGAAAEPADEAPAEEAEAPPPPPPAEEAPETPAAPEEAAPEEPAPAEPAPPESAPAETGGATPEAVASTHEPTPAPTPAEPPAAETGSAKVQMEQSAEAKAEDLVPQASRVSSRSSTREKSRVDGSLTNNLTRLERRLSKIELQKEQAAMEMQQFASNLTGQLKITMEQVNNVTHLLIDRKPNPQRIKILRHIAKQLRVLMGTTGDEVSVSWSSGEIVGAEEEECLEEEEVQEESSAPTEVEKPEEEEELGLEQPLCYSPEKMLNELLDLKSQFCALTNKVNELAAALLKQVIFNSTIFDICVCI